jgi:hypothetical protein
MDGEALAPETDEIDLGIPLPAALADRAHGIEAAVAGLEGYGVERMRAVGSIAKNDVAGMAHGLFLFLNHSERKTFSTGGTILRGLSAPRQCWSSMPAIASPTAFSTRA